MFTIDEMLSKNNQRLALAHFTTKKDGCGTDGMHVSELEKYWKMNHKQIISDLNGIECSNKKVIEKEEFADLINKNRCKQQVPCMSGLDEVSLEER